MFYVLDSARNGSDFRTYDSNFIGKRRVWKGGFPHLETKAEIMGGVVKFK